MNPSENLHTLIDRLGYQFRSPQLLNQALTHRSAGQPNNERLEYLGDAVLDLIIGEELYLRYPQASEGELTRLRATLVNGKTLSKLAGELNLGDALVMGAGEKKTGGSGRESLLADALEAILGAMYLEAGLDLCRQRVKNWFGSRLNAISLESEEKDAKTRLQEHLQGQGRRLPEYEVTATEGDPHNQTLTVTCQIEGVDSVFIASGTSRKKAEKQAAQLAIDYLQGGSDQ